MGDLLSASMLSRFGDTAEQTVNWALSYRPEDAEQIEKLLTAMRDGANEAGFPTEVRIEGPPTVRVLP